MPKRIYQQLKKTRHKVQKLPYPLRVTIGIATIILGLLGIALPILGLWMVPLGLLILSVDFPWARRCYASLLWWFRRRKKNK